MSSSINKRDFLKRIALVGAAGVAVPQSIKAETLETESKKKVITRTLGRTGIKVPVLSSGALSWGNEGLVRAIFKSGIKHFDSALVYGEGKNEEMIGKMIKEFGRKKFVIASKVKNDFDYKEKKFLSADIGDEFAKKLDKILKLMQVDSLDILYVHDVRCREQVVHPAIIAAAEKAKKEGKAKFIGVSTHENVAEVFDAAIGAGIYDIALGSYNFRSGQDVKDAFARAAQAGLGTVAMKSLAGGFLDKEKTKPVNKTGGIRSVLQDANVHTVIKGIYSIDELNQLLSIMYDLNMSEAEKKDIETAKTYAGLYCLGCGTCRPQCPYGLSVPDMMRAYMYTYGYGEPSRGKELVMEHSITEKTCSECPTCSVECKMGFPVAERIRDIARLRNVSGDFLV